MSHMFMIHIQILHGYKIETANVINIWVDKTDVAHLSEEPEGRFPVTQVSRENPDLCEKSQQVGSVLLSSYLLRDRVWLWVQMYVFVLITHYENLHQQFWLKPCNTVRISAIAGIYLRNHVGHRTNNLWIHETILINKKKDSN